MPIPTRREFRVPGLNESISHYTDAVSFGDLLFVSGIGPLAEDGSLVGGDDAGAQTRQIFRNLDRVLRAAGASPADILKVTVYLTDIADRVKINPARQEFFGAARPASTLVEFSKVAVPTAREPGGVREWLVSRAVFESANRRAQRGKGRWCDSPRMALMLTFMKRLPVSSLPRV